MRGNKLPDAALHALGQHVDDLFTKLKNRFLGYIPGKRIIIGYTRNEALPAMYEQGSLEENVKPDTEKLDRVLHIAGGYIDAARERTKARLQHAVETVLTDAHHGKIAPDAVEEEMETTVNDIMTRAGADVKTILEAETNRAKNLGILDGIIAVNSAQGISDPTIVFLVVHDNALCEECRRLHLMPDEITPRAWKLSEIGAGYHKKGESEPKIGGLHPNCRCTKATILPGYGFIAGSLRFIKMGYDLYEAQNH